MTRLDDLDIDVIEIMEGLGLNLAQQVGNEQSFHCFGAEHSHGDKNASASINVTNGLWICYGCKRSGNIVDLVCQVEGVSPYRALRWLREKYEQSWRPVDGSVASMVKSILERKEDAAPEKSLTQLADDAGDGFRVRWHDVADAWVDGSLSMTSPLSYPMDRGFSAETLIKFEIGHDVKTNRMTIPVHDTMGNLVGFRGRATDPAVEPRYRVLGPSAHPWEPYPVSLVVWNAHRAVPDDNTLILCEGELDVMAMDQLGFKNAIATTGSSISDKQASIIASMCKRVIVFYDSDKAGVEGAARVAAKLEGRISVRIVGSHDYDPADIMRERGTRGDVQAILDNSILSTLLPIAHMV